MFVSNKCSPSVFDYFSIRLITPQNVRQIEQYNFAKTKTGMYNSIVLDSEEPH